MRIYLPGIRDRLLIVLSKFPLETDFIGRYHSTGSKIELDWDLDVSRFSQTFWHEIWHMIEHNFKDISKKKQEEVRADLFGEFMTRLLGARTPERLLGKWRVRNERL